MRGEKRARFVNELLSEWTDVFRNVKNDLSITRI